MARVVSWVGTDTESERKVVKMKYKNKSFDLCEPLDSPIQLNERFRRVIWLLDLMLLLLLRLMQLKPDLSDASPWEFGTEIAFMIIYSGLRGASRGSAAP